MMRSNRITVTMVALLVVWFISPILPSSLKLGANFLGFSLEEDYAEADGDPTDINPVILFDQLLKQFVSTGQTITMPIGATALINTSKLTMSVSGLPGATVQTVTDPVNLGPRVAVNLTWTPSAAGTYNVQLIALDTVSGYKNIETFDVIVADLSVNNQSPIIAPLSVQQVVVGETPSVQQVVVGETLTLPISATRRFAPNSTANLTLQVTGLDGTPLTVTGLLATPLSTSGTLVWEAPNITGLNFINIQVSDAYGALAYQWIPVFVETIGTAPIEFDPLSTQFMSIGQTMTIPIGATAFSNASQLKILSVAGLPGVTLQSVTDPVNLGNRVAMNMTWTAPAVPGQYVCSVTIFDRWGGNFMTAMFPVVVSLPPSCNTWGNWSACSVNPCGQTGTQTRSCASCGAGGCPPSQSQSCRGTFCKTGTCSNNVCQAPISKKPISQSTAN